MLSFDILAGKLSSLGHSILHIVLGGESVPLLCDLFVVLLLLFERLPNLDFQAFHCSNTEALSVVVRQIDRRNRIGGYPQRQQYAQQTNLLHRMLISVVVWVQLEMYSPGRYIDACWSCYMHHLEDYLLIFEEMESG